MIKFLNNKNINSPLATLWPALVCVLVITLFTVAWNTQLIRQSSAAEAANQSGDNVASKEKKRVCREEQRPASHFKTRICKSQAEWDVIDKVEVSNSKEYNRRINERSASTTSTAPGGDAYMGGGTTATSQ